jgi:putative flippase GtrA
VGIWNTVFGYSIFVLLYNKLNQNVSFNTITIISYFISVTMAYVMYKYIVFKSSAGGFSEYVRFIIVYLWCLFVNIIIINVLCSKFRFSVYIAQGISVIVVIIASYYSHNKFSFKKE